MRGMLLGSTESPRPATHPSSPAATPHRYHRHAMQCAQYRMEKNILINTYESNRRGKLCSSRAIRSEMRRSRMSFVRRTSLRTNFRAFLSLAASASPGVAAS